MIFLTEKKLKKIKIGVDIPDFMCYTLTVKRKGKVTKMTRTVTTNPIKYTYNPTHSNSHYLIDGEDAYKNGGEFAEIVCKAIRGFEPEKDANVPFDKGSDIEETKTSIKSHKCGLTDTKDMRQSTKEYYVEQYFKRVHSTNVDYVIFIDEMVYIYNMDMQTEFKEFINKFGKWYDKKIRLYTTAEMIKWFEEKCA